MSLVSFLCLWTTPKLICGILYAHKFMSPFLLRNIGFALVAATFGVG